MIDELEKACHIVNEDRNISVLILTASDPAFSAGGNIKDMATKSGMFAGRPTELMVNYRKFVQRIPLIFQKIEVPVIAAVNGPAIGAGFDMTMMCDMRVASERARFGETFLNVGLIPGDGGAWFLPKVVGMAKACELTFTGEIIDAQEALSINLVSYVVSHDGLMQKTLEIAEKISTKPPEALRMAKRLLYMGQRLSLPDLLEQSASLQALCHHTDDHLEALAAMSEKRKPNFIGK
jgi:enoyl-CoA hydratase/carnithine racemase